MKQGFCILISLGFILSSEVQAENFSSIWTRTNDSWKRGYVFGIGETLHGVADNHDPKSIAYLNGYRACLVETSDAALVRVVDMYWQRNPTAASQAALGVVIKALAEMCSRYLPK